MIHLKRPCILLMLLTLIITSRTSAQDLAQQLFNFDAKGRLAREKEVIQNNEYVTTGYEKGIFISNPLMLDGKPLEYSEFNIQSKGELTVCKGTAIKGQTTQIPFYVYLRRDGNTVLISPVKTDQIKIDLADVLKHAKPGDLLVIQAVNKEDGPVKRILKLLGGGC